MRARSSRWSTRSAMPCARPPPDARNAARLRTLRDGPAGGPAGGLHLLVRVHLLRRVRRSAGRGLPELRRGIARPADAGAKASGEESCFDGAAIQGLTFLPIPTR